jgi:LCP family protein required for cell wall assembly
MKTTLKRGIGRGAAVNGNGRAVFPPGVHTPMSRYRQPDRPRRGPWQVVRAVVGWTLVVAVVVAGGVAGAAYLKTHQFIEAISPKTRADRAAAKQLDVAIPGQPTTALVIGTDRRKGFQAELTGRSDTLILVRADPSTNSLSMLSFPRDLVVTLKCPGRPDARDRINAAYSNCGTLGSVETVRALTGLPINYFVTVNFRGFTDLVNNLGGVWVDVDHRYLCDPSTCPGVSKINLFPGYQRLNATNALAYVRYRHFDSDLYRNARQQLFLKALKQQISSQLGLDTLFSIVDAVEKNVVVGRGGNKALDPQTLKDYLYFAHGLPSGNVFQTKIEGLTGGNELYATPEAVAAAVRDFVRTSRPPVRRATSRLGSSAGRRRRGRVTRRPPCSTATASPDPRQTPRTSSASAATRSCCRRRVSRKTRRTSTTSAPPCTSIPRRSERRRRRRSSGTSSAMRS